MNDTASNQPNLDITASLDQAIRDLRAEFQTRLEETRGQLTEQIATAEAERATAAEAQDRQAAVDAAKLEESREEAARAQAAAAQATETAGDLLGELHNAVIGIDQADSQPTILAALLSGVERFTPFCALILTSEEGHRPWAPDGSAPTDGLALDSAGDLVDLLSDGRGGLDLSPGDCSRLHPGQDSATGGMLTPLVLGDRVAAAIYAEQGDSWQPHALQLLTFVAGQALENLPFRERRSTGTLRWSADAPGNEKPLGFWPAPAEIVDTATTAAEPEGLAAAEDEIIARAADTPGAGGSVDPLETVSMAALPEMPSTPMVPEMPAVPDAFEQEEEAVEASESVVDAEVESPFEVVPEPEPVTDDSAFIPRSQVDDSEPAVAGATQWIETPVKEPEEVAAEPLSEEPAVQAPGVSAPVPQVEPAVQGGGEANDDQATAEVPVAPPPVPAKGSAQVAPPPDLEGPGLAFASDSQSTSAAALADQDEARRLARLLVSEIKLYNEQDVLEGRRHGDIYRRLKDDIDRSREAYEQRISAEVRADQDFFHEALVQILGGGDVAALGA